MRREEILVTIGKDGELAVEVHGAVGAGCEALTKALEAELGEVASRTATAERMERPERVANKQTGTLR